MDGVCVSQCDKVDKERAALTRRWERNGCAVHTELPFRFSVIYRQRNNRFLLSVCFSVYSMTIPGIFIQTIPFFCMENQASHSFPFRGPCPHPASGIRVGFSGNTMGADGISRGSRHFECSRPGFPFLQILGQPFPI